MDAIELFSGGGGFTTGLIQAGFSVVAAVEKMTRAVETHRLNIPRTIMIDRDIREVSFTEYRGIDLVAGSPPCQPFSSKGAQAGRLDPRDMVPEFVRAVREAAPKAFVLENVQGLLNPKHSMYLSWVKSQFIQMGYTIYIHVLNSANYGVPQARKRVFIVGLRDGILFTPPPHATYKVSARDAMKGAAEDKPNPTRVRYVTNPVLRKSPYAGFLVNGHGRPFDLDKPSPTILAASAGSAAHIIDTQGVLRDYHAHLIAGGKPRTGIVPDVRRMTANEAARLQAFPDWFEFLGGRTARCLQIGNAVPPPLAQAVGEAVMQALEQRVSATRAMLAPTQFPMFAM